MNKILLSFDKTLSALSGNDFGRSIYLNQIKNQINMDEHNTIVFDSSILIIGISFVKGMFSELLENYSIDDLREKISFQCSSKEVEMSIWDSLEF